MELEKSRLGMTRYRENPSLATADQQQQTKKRLKKVKVRGNDGKSEWHNGEIGEVIQGAVLFQEEEVDMSKFVKLYTAGIAVVRELNKAGAKVLEIIISELEYNKDEIFVNSKRISAEYGVSIPTLKRGLKDLREKEVLFDHFNGDGWFFINVAYMFVGERYTLVKHYRIKRQQEEQEEIENPNQPQLPFEGEIVT